MPVIKHTSRSTAHKYVSKTVSKSSPNTDGYRVTKTKEVTKGLNDNKTGNNRKVKTVTKSYDSSGNKIRGSRRVVKSKLTSGNSGDVLKMTKKNNSGTSRSVTTRTQDGGNMSTKTNMGAAKQALAFRKENKKIK